MSFNFPGSPTVGQGFTPPGGPSFTWDGVAWKASVSGAVISVYVSDTAPVSPGLGQMWWDSDTGNLFIWYADPDSSQWVQVSGVVASAGNVFSTAADMSIGFRTSGNRFVVNDKADMSGTDVMTVSEAGTLTVNGSITANSGGASGFFTGGTTNTFLSTATGSSGSIYLRPNGAGSTTGQTTIDSAGNMTVAGTITAANMLINTFSATGASDGKSIGATSLQSSRTSTSGVQHQAFYNPNGAVGSITTNASTTAYSTSSDERLKNVGADYDPAEAIAIIRADPVKNFQWKAGNIDAVGWIAQRSYAVHEDLATRVAATEAGEKGEPAQDEFWGIDYGRRTPYLWAALTHALDEIEALKARLAALEGASS